MTADRLERWYAWVLAAAVPVTALASAPGGLDPVALPKLTAVVVLLLVILAVASLRGRRMPRQPVALTAAHLAVGSFVVAGVVAVVTAERLPLALLGRHGRHEGFVLYASAAALFLCALRLASAGFLPRLLRALTLCAGVLAAYALVQAAGLDPVQWRSPFGPMLGTFGNPNFLAGFVGATVPACAALTLSARAVRQRLLFGAIGAAALSVTVLSNSQQGPVAALAGCAVVLLARGWAGSWPSRRVAAGVAIVVTATAATFVAFGLFGSGPLSGFFGSSAIQTRLWYWRAAADMVADSPVVGLGWDHFGDYFRRYRPIEAIEVLNALTVADEPHSVPLAMFVSGGLLLGVGYLSITAITAWALLRGLRRSAGDVNAMVTLAGLGGVWAGYHVQSLVSMDPPAHAVLHWIVSGAIVGAAALPAMFTWDRSRPRPTRKTRKGRKPARAGALVTAGTAVGFGAALVVALIPLRADLAAGRGLAMATAGDGTAALRSWNAAVQLAPWQDDYWSERGRLLVAARRYDQALQSYDQALRRSPRSVPYLVTSARLAAELGRVDDARERYRRALLFDPTGPEVLGDVVKFQLAHGRPADAEPLARRLVRVSPRILEWWLLLARSEAATGDVDGARAALDSAAQLAPTDPIVAAVREELKLDE